MEVEMHGDHGNPQSQLLDRSHTMEHDSLNSKPRPEPEKDAPFQPFSSRFKPVLGRFLPHLVQNK